MLCYFLVFILFMVNTYISLLLLTPKFNDLINNRSLYFIDN